MDRSKKVLFGDLGEPHSSKNNSKSHSPFTAVLEDGTIAVHPETSNPTRLWEKLSVHQNVKKVKNMSRKTPIHPNKLRFVCISDTHNKTHQMSDPIPDGDVLIHGGDFTMVGQIEQTEHFNKFLGNLPHPRKVVIAGNHELSFDKDVLDTHKAKRFGLNSEAIYQHLKEKGFSEMKDILTNCTDYLEDSGVEICGIKMFGSPWQPWFGDWGFNLERGQPCLDKWNLIPDDVDVLITHGPPIGHGDYCSSGQRAGCVELLHSIQHRIKPQYHVFGHIHEGYGITSDGFTKYINASTCTFNYKGTNPPIIFDIPIPPGFTKDDLLKPDNCEKQIKTDDKCDRDDDSNVNTKGDEASASNVDEN